VPKDYAKAIEYYSIITFIVIRVRVEQILEAMASRLSDQAIRASKLGEILQPIMIPPTYLRLRFFKQSKNRLLKNLK
jgi:hypothetical protein